jgi:hypothetical protein
MTIRIKPGFDVSRRRKKKINRNKYKKKNKNKSKNKKTQLHVRSNSPYELLIYVIDKVA